jgi:carbon starvation protein
MDEVILGVAVCAGWEPPRLACGAPSRGELRVVYHVAMLFALTLWHVESASDGTGRVVLHALPVMLGALCILAIAYRYYSAFLAAKVAVLDDKRTTPAMSHPDGQNYHPTNKWVLFGHHFAAISGAGPLIGPVLAIQYGYLPGLLWLIIGVCLAGAVQDMLVLTASVRCGGKSLAEIAKRELGKPAAVIASLAILFIIVIALAGLGIVVVKALGGEEAKLPDKYRVYVFKNGKAKTTPMGADATLYTFPQHCEVWMTDSGPPGERSESFGIKCPNNPGCVINESIAVNEPAIGQPGIRRLSGTWYEFPKGCTQVIPGSSWGTFTIACTIPIAILVGLLMKRFKKFGVLAGSLLGGALTLFAVVAGGWIPGSPLEPFFSLSKDATVLALVVYGFIAAVLPVWLLLGPRDYLSSFLKIGTVVLLVGSVCIANPPLNAPAFNQVFSAGGPTFQGNIFPFVFICVMCGAVSGFHSLVSSGTTPKMIEKETHIRSIGYGAMLIEGLVGITALIAAAALPNELYYDINIAIDKAPAYQEKLRDIHAKYGRDPLHAANVNAPAHLNLGEVEQKVGGESLRGRTGGAVTLAVGMSVIFEDAFRWIGVQGDWLLKYWYHFAIMFEALFILTTIDAGTRIGRFLLQETLGRVYEPFSRPNWLPGSLIASGVITGAWGLLIYTGSVDTIWPMFGVANQSLSILALTLITTWLVNQGKEKWMWVTLIPLLWVCSTTLTAATLLVTERFPAMMSEKPVTATLSTIMTVFVVVSVLSLLTWSVARWVVVLRRK